MSKLPLVITDLDGTVVNLMDEVIAYIYKITDVALTPDCCRVYDVHKSFAPYLCPPGEPAPFSSAKALRDFLIKTCWLNPGRLRNARPYWDLWRTLLYYQSKGGLVVGLTSRNKDRYGLEQATASWLVQWLPEMPIHYSMDYAGDTVAQQKLQACTELYHVLGGDGFISIDDEPEVAKLINERGPTGCTMLMPDRPWTQSAEIGIKCCDPAGYLQDVVANAMGVT